MSYRNNHSKEFTILWVKAEQKQLHQAGFHSVNKIYPKQIKINRTPRETFSTFEFQSNKGNVHQIMRPELQTYNKLVQPGWPWRPNWRKLKTTKTRNTSPILVCCSQKGCPDTSRSLVQCLALTALLKSNPGKIPVSARNTFVQCSHKVWAAVWPSWPSGGHSMSHPICVASKWRARTIHL